ncbi:thiolase [Gordonia phthalatica]|uniref:Thiolase n=2 Tax=Gordonia phthalatica TaxID=1136941 RepID=A0A0N9NDN4_9ACTN|nr:thiolase [Gordonia phthalatica]
MTEFGVHRALSVKQLVASAVGDALADAGAETGSLDVAFFGTATQGRLEGQTSVPGEIALREMGIGAIPVFNVENACATGASAFALACAHLRAGLADVALAVGVEKMHTDDPAAAMAVFEGGFDVNDRAGLDRDLAILGGASDTSDVGRRSIFMDIYAAMARSHMGLYGTTAEQIAAVASKNHAHAIDNPRAFYRKNFTIEEVLAARPLAPPITVPMCSPVTDGAAAAIVCTEAGLKRLRAAGVPVRVLAFSVATGTDRDITNFENHVSSRAAQKAYEQAGVGPEEVSVAEVHDATAFGELLQSELMGLVPEGDGGPAALRGDTTIGGRIPINPSGGLESKGHPIGATGLGQVFELVEQLRGRAGSRQVEGARIALAENGGGFHRGEEAVASVIILGSE